MDEDGYPDEEELKRIREWDWKDPAGLFAFIKARWYMPDWGWHEETGVDDVITTKRGTWFRISTAGWSGNESIMEAWEANHMIWTLFWVSSRRGGHFEFFVADDWPPPAKDASSAP